MKQFESEKYTVAWYKLAEIVARGEKERALALYRLLVHSFDDQALAHQLEGDLLMSFNDTSAIQSFKKAAELFTQQQRFVEAAAVYEHICLLDPLDIISLYELLGLYSRQRNIFGFIKTAQKIIDAYITQNKSENIVEFITNYENSCAESELNKLYMHATLQLIKNDASQNTIDELLKLTMERLLLSDNPMQLQSFLSQIKAVNSVYFQQASQLVSA